MHDDIQAELRLRLQYSAHTVTFTVENNHLDKGDNGQFRPLFAIALH